MPNIKRKERAVAFRRRQSQRYHVTTRDAVTVHKWDKVIVEFCSSSTMHGLQKISETTPFIAQRFVC